MGRTIPSFRIFIEIEKSEWLHFRKYLTKEDRTIFNKLFSIPKLYCHCLSHLSKPLIFESIIMIILFHNFKVLRTMIETLTTTKALGIKDYKREQKRFVNSSIDKKRKQNYQQQQNLQIKNIKSEEAEKYTSDKIIEEWEKFIDCLNNDDKNAFIFMIKSCYDTYHNSIEANINANSDACLNRLISLFMALILYQQKQIDLMKSNQRFFD